MERRTEIDGLRSFAILPVILCHAGFSFFEGGYVGVDIFFVISGFLISTIISNDYSGNKFSIAKFYKRRAVRILPVLFFVTLCCIPVFWILMTPVELHWFAKSIVGLCFFASNVVFCLESGYFDLSSAQKPLLHTWSLGVEEQFYFFFPLLFILILKYRKAYQTWIIIGILVIDLVFAQFFSIKNANASFYLIVSRIWELMLGVFASIISARVINRAKPWVSNILSIAGLLLICVSFFVFKNNHYPHPGFITLLPTIGTVLVLLFAYNGNSVATFLSTSLLVQIGLLSYSAYLWHHPVFAVGRFLDLDSTFYKLASILLVFLLAYLSYRFIETPFRFKYPFRLKKYFLVWIAVVGFGFVAFFIDWTPWFEYRLNETQKKGYSTAERSPYRESCHGILDTAKACHYFGSNITWAVLGDSHGIELAYALGQKIKAGNEGVIQFTNSSPPAYSFSSGIEANDAWLKNVVKYLTDHTETKNVLLVWRHSAYLYGNNEEYFPDTINNSKTLFIKSGNDPDTKRQLYMQSFCSLVNKLAELNKQVYVMMPVPEQGKHVFNFINKLNKYRVNMEGVSIAYYQKRNQFFFDHLSAISDKVTCINPVKILGTSNAHTYVVKNGQSLYFDDNHLSITAASFIIDEILRLR